jgi:hypothetical protein
MNWSALRTVLPAWFWSPQPTLLAQMKAIYQAGDQQATQRIREKRR